MNVRYDCSMRGVAVLLFALGGVVCIRESAAQGIVHGTAVNHNSTEPIVGATIELRTTSRRTKVVATGVTDEAGHFSLGTAAPGTYRLHGERIGFQTVDSSPFELLPGAMELDVVLELDIKAVLLAPLTIVSARPARFPGHLAEFYDRMREWGPHGLGMGIFIQGADVRRAAKLTNVLRTVRGIMVEGTGGTGAQVVMRGPHTFGQAKRGGLGSRCVPAFFVDGVKIDGIENVDQLVPVGDIAAVEVYPGTNAPAQFQRGQLCGAIAVWTGVITDYK